MNVNKITPQKHKAQAMVEFAIVLPILLLLLYGILEAGRLLFIYSTIVTASRQAVRYGSATGQGAESPGVKRYNDCAGIRLAAQRVDYLNAFDDEDIIIQYDTGPNTTPVTFCPNNNPDISFDPGSSNSYRLVVKIEGDYLPIVPKIVPFLSRSKNDPTPDPIEAESARTVLVSVSIQVTVPPSTWTPSTPTDTPSPIASPTFTPTDTPTDTPSPTPLVTNTPSRTPSPTLSPTITRTPTKTLSPTVSPTPVPRCDNLTWGDITLTGSTMTLAITNPNPYAVRVQDVYAVWDYDRGHQNGNDKSLHLISVSLGVQFWTGDDDGVGGAFITPPPATPVLIPNGTSTIIFTFHQAYERSDGSEEILINLSTNGCQFFPIHEKR